MNEQVDQQFIAQLKAAIDQACNPSNVNSAREAVTWLESLKADTSSAEKHITRALFLVEESPRNVQYCLFGLQLLDHIVKISWYDLSSNARLYIKTRMELLMHQDNIPEGFLKDAVGRVIVEILMRDWPQNWSAFLPSALSHPRNWTFLYILWRLAEDVAIHMKPNNTQRRREILNSITLSLTDILSYISDCLQSNDPRLNLLSLNTLSAYLEWITIDGSLLRFLLHILSLHPSSTDSFLVQSKVIACDCLTTILSRKKVKDEEKAALTSLVEEQILLTIFNFSSTCLKNVSEGSFDPAFLEVSKRACTLISTLGRFMLSGLVSVNQHTKDNFMQELLVMFSHRNQSVSFLLIDFWKEFMRLSLKESSPTSTDVSASKSAIHVVLRHLFGLISQHLMKLPREHDFVIHDFDCYEDYESFFKRNRAELLELLRQMTLLNDVVMVECAFHLLQQLLDSDDAKGNFSQRDSRIQQWEAMGTILDCICNRLPSPEKFAQKAIPYWNLLMNDNNSREPLFLSLQLSCLSALSIFLPHLTYDLTRQLIHRVFYLAAFPRPEISSKPVDDHFSKGDEVTTLRRHASAAFVKLATRFPRLLLPMFGEIRDQVYSPSKEFSHMQIEQFSEGLVLISNTFPDVSSQKAFVCHLLTQIHSIESFARMDTKTFMSTVGLMSPTETEEHINNRKVLLFSVNMALGLMRRTDKKENLVPEILPLIRSLVSLLCILNEMWDPSFRSLCNPALADKVFSPATDSEKNHLLEFVQSTPSSNAVPPVSYFSSDPETHVVNASQFQIDKILQSFLASLYEILLTILGLSCSFFPSIIFVIPSASPNEIVTTHPFLTVLNKSHYLPRMRLRTMLKQFLLPFIKHCPLQEENVKSCLFPLFSTFIPWMFKHIDDHWDIFRNRSVTTTDDDERLEHEVIEDQSNRILSKEFLDLMSSAFIYTPPGKHTCSSTSGTTEQETEMDSTTRDDIVNDSSETVISEVGKCLLRNDLASMVRIIFGQLTWVDSILCLKASRTICRVILRELLSYRLISTADDVSFFVHHVFFSLKLFGENEENVSSLLQLVLILWEGLIKNNEPSDVKAPLWLLSSRQAGDWLSLEESLIRPSLTSSKNSKVNDKKKKDAIKPLLTNVIGKSTGELFSFQKAQIKCLQPFALKPSRKKQGKNILDEEGGEEDAICRLFS